MRRQMGPQIFFMQGLIHKMKFQIFEIADSTMKHLWTFRTGFGAEIIFVHKQNLMAMKGQVSEDAGPDNSTTNNERFNMVWSLVKIHIF